MSFNTVPELLVALFNGDAGIMQDRATNQDLQYTILSKEQWINDYGSSDELSFIIHNNIQYVVMNYDGYVDYIITDPLVELTPSPKPLEIQTFFNEEECSLNITEEDIPKLDLKSTLVVNDRKHDVLDALLIFAEKPISYVVHLPPYYLDTATQNKDRVITVIENEDLSPSEMTDLIEFICSCEGKLTADAVNTAIRHGYPIVLEYMLRSDPSLYTEHHNDADDYETWMDDDKILRDVIVLCCHYLDTESVAVSEKLGIITQ